MATPKTQRAADTVTVNPATDIRLPLTYSGPSKSGKMLGFTVDGSAHGYGRGEAGLIVQPWLGMNLPQLADVAEEMPEYEVIIRRVV